MLENYVSPSQGEQLSYFGYDPISQKPAWTHSKVQALNSNR